MILVDTSVLINYLKNIDSGVTIEFGRVLAHKIPFGINNFIYQELLQGCRSEKDFKLLKKYLDTQTFYEFQKGRESHAEAAKMYFTLRKQGITIRSTIDCLIAQMAIENDIYLFHNDKDITRIAQHFPLRIWSP